MSVAILNVGQGDTKISFDPSRPEERERAKMVVEDMLRRGFAILVHVGEQDGKPIYQRAEAFDPKTCEYIIAGTPTEAAPDEKGKKKRRVKAEGTPAVAVARSAGGMSDRADSVERQNLRACDQHHLLRSVLDAFAAKTSAWAGVPMPLDGHPLVIEPRYPRAQELMAIVPRAPAAKGVRSTWYSHHLRSEVVMLEREGGGFEAAVVPALHSFTAQLFTMGASVAWGVEQEARAINFLATLIRHDAFKKYLLTGMFLETSQRSGVTYAFRRLRPTVAIKVNRESGDVQILAALCMHPIAYYEGSWAGAMCPTDDLIAHLMLMRGDERLFWARSNQHPAHRPEAGL